MSIKSENSQYLTIREFANRAVVFTRCIYHSECSYSI